MDYRREVDGLRAVAVIPVILFHAGFQSFSGGFVGVDVFFVISGYLITTIILSEKEKGTFSLVNFYERRARRILPALFLVMLVSLPFAWLWLWPSDLKDFSKSLVGVSLFASNILFWQETGYWGAENELKPLLHTWSLAVEEQYYMLFPLFLMFMWRFRKRWILGSFLVVAATSLVVAHWGSLNHPTATFFLLPTRGWELAIGASIAFYFLYRKQVIRTLLSHKSVDEILSLLGLMMIGYAVFAFDETVPFPSFYALIPTVGTGLIIIFSSSKTVIGRILGAKPLVGIGLISYSAYLWHQPLFAFARHRSLGEPNEVVFVGLSIFSIVLAYLSWRYVEVPFRKRDILNRKAIFIFAAFGSLAFISIGLIGHISNGFDGRSTKSGILLNSVEEKLEGNHGLNKECEGSFTVSNNCRTSDEPEVLIWGDSFAMHLVQGVIASKNDVKIIQMTKSMCGSFFDVAPVISQKHSVSRAKDCLGFSNKVREWLKENKTVKYAVLSSNFDNYLSRGNSLLFRNGARQNSNAELVEKELTNTLEELKAMGIMPVVFSPMPSSGDNLGRCLARAVWLSTDLNKCNFLVNDISQSRQESYALLDTIMDKYPVIRLDKLICNDIYCKTHFDPIFIYRDKHHLSHEGSAELGGLFNFSQMILNKHLN